MSINPDMIMGKLQAYAKTSTCKVKIDDTLKEYAKKNIKKTLAGNSVFPEERMDEAAGRFLSYLRREAESANLPDSVMAHILDSDVGKPIYYGGRCTVPIYFGGDKRRDSLRSVSKNMDQRISGEYGVYTGEGIDNIVALFNNGYNASHVVFGVWHENPALKDRDNLTFSRTYRDATHFIQSAVEDFLGNFGSEYNVNIEISNEYRD